LLLLLKLLFLLLLLLLLLTFSLPSLLHHTDPNPYPFLWLMLLHTTHCCRLANKRLIALDVGSVVAGTSYRGEFEERLQALLQDCETAGGSVVLFIDEIHVLSEFGAWSLQQRDCAVLSKLNDAPCRWYSVAVA
jgi:hypothetical protein